jgi:hypothetical protein
MATNLLVTAETKVASLVKLAVESNGIPVTAAFWLRLPEADYPSIALAIPLADKLGAREVYGRVMAILDKETFAPKPFLLSRLAVFGERESAEALHALRVHSSLVSKLDHYRNVEIEEVPDAVDIREDLRLEFFFDAYTSLYKVFFRPLLYSGVVPAREIQSEFELKQILLSLGVRVEELNRILESLKLKQWPLPEIIISDIGLDTLYRLKLVWIYGR